MQLKDNPLQVLRIDGERKTGKGVENVYAESIQDGGKESLTGTIQVEPGTQASVTFAVQDASPGFYLLQFAPCWTQIHERHCIIQKYVGIH